MAKKLLFIFLIFCTSTFCVFGADFGVMSAPPVQKHHNTGNNTQRPPAPSHPNVYPPPPHRPPHNYYPRRYNYVYVTPKDKKETVNNTVINNYYFNNKEDSDKYEQKALDIEAKKLQLEEEERNMLQNKYSSILSNKTMSNEKMCTKMEAYFRSADYYELDRVLNKLLYLNCDIDKFRKP